MHCTGDQFFCQAYYRGVVVLKGGVGPKGVGRPIDGRPPRGPGRTPRAGVGFSKAGVRRGSDEVLFRRLSRAADEVPS